MHCADFERRTFILLTLILPFRFDERFERIESTRRSDNSSSDGYGNQKLREISDFAMLPRGAGREGEWPLLT